MTREMAELQTLAEHARQEPPREALGAGAQAHAVADGDDDLSGLDGDDYLAQPMPSSAAANGGGGAANGHGGERAPLRFTPASDGGLNLEALDGLDLDGLLARLEAEKEAEGAAGMGHR